MKTWKYRLGLETYVPENILLITVAIFKLIKLWKCQASCEMFSLLLRWRCLGPLQWTNFSNVGHFLCTALNQQIVPCIIPTCQLVDKDCLLQYFTTWGYTLDCITPKSVLGFKMNNDPIKGQSCSVMGNLSWFTKGLWKLHLVIITNTQETIKWILDKNGHVWERVLIPSWQTKLLCWGQNVF